MSNNESSATFSINVAVPPNIVRDYFDGVAKVERAKNEYRAPPVQQSSFDWTSLIGLASVVLPLFVGGACSTPHVRPSKTRSRRTCTTGQTPVSNETKSSDTKSEDSVQDICDILVKSMLDSEDVTPTSTSNKDTAEPSSATTDKFMDLIESVFEFGVSTATDSVSSKKGETVKNTSNTAAKTPVKKSTSPTSSSKNSTVSLGTVKKFFDLMESALNDGTGDDGSNKKTLDVVKKCYGLIETVMTDDKPASSSTSTPNKASTSSSSKVSTSSSSKASTSTSNKDSTSPSTSASTNGESASSSTVSSTNETNDSSNTSTASTTANTPKTPIDIDNAVNDNIGHIIGMISDIFGVATLETSSNIKSKPTTSEASSSSAAINSTSETVDTTSETTNTSNKTTDNTSNETTVDTSNETTDAASEVTHNTSNHATSNTQNQTAAALQAAVNMPEINKVMDALGLGDMMKGLNDFANNFQNGNFPEGNALNLQQLFMPPGAFGACSSSREPVKKSVPSTVHNTTTCSAESSVKKSVPSTVRNTTCPTESSVDYDISIPVSVVDTVDINSEDAQLIAEAAAADAELIAEITSANSNTETYD